MSFHLEDTRIGYRPGATPGYVTPGRTYPANPAQMACRWTRDQRSPASRARGNGSPAPNVGFRQMEPDMDKETRHEITVLALSTLAALPLVTGIGLAIVAGALAW
jgi:hypothetical protein